MCSYDRARLERRWVNASTSRKHYTGTPASHNTIEGSARQFLNRLISKPTYVAFYAGIERRNQAPNLSHYIYTPEHSELTSFCHIEINACRTISCKRGEATPWTAMREDAAPIKHKNSQAESSLFTLFMFQLLVHDFQACFTLFILWNFLLFSH